MSDINRIILLAISVVFSTIAHAGGMSWQIEIHEFKRVSETTAVATISTLKETKSFEGCSKFVVNFEYDTKKIESTNIKRFVSLESQIESLDRIERVSTHAKPVMMLGSMGAGFRYIGECTFQSLGLGPLEEYNGREVIYSFNYPI